MREDGSPAAPVLLTDASRKRRRHGGVGLLPDRTTAGMARGDLLMDEKDRIGARNSGLLAVAILLLAVVVAVLAYLNFRAVTSGSARLQEGRITVMAGGAAVRTVTIDDLRKLPAVHKKMAVRSSRGTAQHDYTGASLPGVLNGIDPGLTVKYTRIVSSGADGYTSVIGMSEALLPDNVYLVYEDSGKPLKTLQGQDGGVQIVICNDEFGQRFTNWLVSLELQ